MTSLESTLQKLSDDDLIRMVYVVPEDYTTEGVECAKIILETRGVRPDEAQLKDKISEVVENEVETLSQPKELNPISRLFSLDYVVWWWRIPAGLVFGSKVTDPQFYSLEGFAKGIIYLGIWVIVLYGLERIHKNKKDKEALLREESIQNVEAKAHNE
jgi:hypothetical protein